MTDRSRQPSDRRLLPLTPPGTTKHQRSAPGTATGAPRRCCASPRLRRSSARALAEGKVEGEVDTRTSQVHKTKRSFAVIPPYSLTKSPSSRAVCAVYAGVGVTRDKGMGHTGPEISVRVARREGGRGGRRSKKGKGRGAPSAFSVKAPTAVPYTLRIARRSMKYPHGFGEWDGG